MIGSGTVPLTLMVLTAPLAHGQEVAFKGAIVRSHLNAEGTMPFDQPLIATSLGGHVRFDFGPIALQPELHIVTRGGTVEDGHPQAPDAEDQQLRLEYLEIPLLIALPVQLGNFELVAIGGPMIALESRCRYVFVVGDVKTNVGCDPPSDPLFGRRAFDYGLIAGAGVSYPLGSGRILIEARQTWGMRDIYDGPDAVELFNRSFSLMLGYVVSWTEPAEL
ncbi:hypothetical protein BH23GEM10_BH23GEM10_05350 [soil metagenome]